MQEQNFIENPSFLCFLSIDVMPGALAATLQMWGNTKED